MSARDWLAKSWVDRAVCGAVFHGTQNRQNPQRRPLVIPGRRHEGDSLVVDVCTSIANGGKSECRTSDHPFWPTTGEEFYQRRSTALGRGEGVGVVVNTHQVLHLTQGRRARLSS